MKAQEFEDQSEIRIKLGYRGPGGYLLGYAANSDYDSLLSERPPGWTMASPVDIETKSEGTRRAWVLAGHGTELAAVEHETGLEILGAVAALATIAQFAVWAYDRWKKVEPDPTAFPGPNERTHLLSRTTERFPDGRERIIRTLEVRGPLDSEHLRNVIETFESS